MEVLLFGLIAAMAYLITLTRAIGWDKVLKHSVKVDIAGTVLLALLFSGTYSGMIVGIFSGFLIAIFLTICKKARDANLKVLFNPQGKPKGKSKPWFIREKVVIIKEDGSLERK